MFEFTKDLMIGIPEIDKDHEHLFELLNEGMDLAHNQYLGDRYTAIKALLAELDNYAEQHFTREEKYMEEIRDPELILQRNQHMVFREQIRKWIFTNIVDFDHQHQMLEEIIQYLARWLYRHIISSDALIGKMPPLEKWMLKENPFEFSDEYRTGIDFIDEEHRELFHITDRADKCMRDMEDFSTYDKVVDILNELKDYAKRHFKDEEAYMERIQYEGLPAQRRAHEAFIEKISNFSLDYIDGDPKKYLGSLIEFLLGWLINHIMYTDKKIPLEI